MHVRENLHNAIRKEKYTNKRTEIIIDQVPAITNIHLNNLNVTEYYRIEIKLFLHITKLSLAVTFDIQRLLLDRRIVYFSYEICHHITSIYMNIYLIRYCIFL